MFMKKHLTYFILAALPVSAATYALSADAESLTTENIVEGYVEVLEWADSQISSEADQHIHDYFAATSQNSERAFNAAAQAQTEESQRETFPDTFEIAEAVSDGELASQRGTFNPSTSSFLFADSSNNVAINSVTGQNNISDSAFNNASGVVSVIQNTGNNVVIQSSTVVNLEMCQGAC